MAKRKKKKQVVHRVFAEGPLKSVEIHKPTDFGYDLGVKLSESIDLDHDPDFEAALIDWIVTQREKWKKKRKPGGQ